MTPITVTIRLKDEAQTYKLKELIYPDSQLMYMSRDNPLIGELVERAKANFKGEPDEISVKAEFVW